MMIDEVTMTRVRARKTVEINKLLDYANGFLCAKGGSREGRYAIICMIEHALFAADRYRGFIYLGEDEVASTEKPGIRWEKYDLDRTARFDDTDNTRRRYA